MSSGLRPRALVHHGWIDASGVILEHRLLGLEVARERVRALWEDGAQLAELGEGRWLLRWRVSRRLEAAAAPGLPLVAEGALLAGLPLAASERRACEGAAVVLCVGERLSTFAQIGPPIDPASWLDLAGWTVAEPAVRQPPSSQPVVSFEVRSSPPERLLGPQSALAPERVEVVQGLRSAFTAQRGVGAAGSPAGPKSIDVERAWESGGGLFARFRRWLDRRALARSVGKKNAEYVAELVAMFEDGRLDEALRRALPLGGDAEVADQATRLQDIRRTDLRVGGVSRTTATGLASSLIGALENRYRAALSRLKFEGRHAEAAFVLAELLNRPEEAALHLETEGLYEEAAELAETRALAPDLIVRLHCKAGALGRAAEVARRHGVFAAAVDALERSSHPHAPRLRWQWARELHASGALASAVATAWPIDARRSELWSWIDAGLDDGGDVAMRLIPYALAMVSSLGAEEGQDAGRETLAKVVALVDEVCKAGPVGEVGPFVLRESLAKSLAEAYAVGCPDAVAAALVRPLCRALARDAAGSEARASQALARLLGTVHLGLDDLGADLVVPPEPTPPVPLATRMTPIVLQRERLAAGAHVVHQAAWLGGDVLLAMGELGVRYLRGGGRTLHHFDVPATQLSIADNRASAIAIARRGSLVQLTHLDLVQRRSRSLGAIELVDVAPTFDGTRLWIAAPDAVGALDVHAKTPSLLWRVGAFDGPVRAIARDASQLAFVVELEGAWQSWVYGTSELRLLFKSELAKADEAHAAPSTTEATQGSAPTLSAISPNGMLLLAADHALWMTRFETAWKLAIRHRSSGAARPEGTLGSWLGRPTLVVEGSVAKVLCDGNWLAIERRLSADRSRVGLYDVARLEERLVLELCEVTTSRFDGNTMTVADTRGRVVVVGLEAGAVLSQLVV